MSADITHRVSATTDTKAVAGDTGEFRGGFVLCADATPGAPGPLSAPLHCQSSDEYLRTIRWRYTNSPGVRQQLAAMVRRRGGGHADPLPILGPYAADAARILDALAAERPVHSVRAQS